MERQLKNGDVYEIRREESTHCGKCLLNREPRPLGDTTKRLCFGGELAADCAEGSRLAVRYIKFIKQVKPKA